MATAEMITASELNSFEDYARQLFSNFWSFEQLFVLRATLSSFCLQEQLLSNK